MGYEYRIASMDDLEVIWNKNINDNSGDSCWINWKSEYIGYNIQKMAYTFCIVLDGQPIGEGTLIVSEKCSAIGDRKNLTNNRDIGNINALRIAKEYEGHGHISKLVKMIEAFAKESGIKELTIGVEAKETRNLSIYLHWGYNVFVMSEIEGGELVLYYKKAL
ncbi:MAG TPA: GNAT family N-acetyltransferase [Lachnospiraceae bacterium]|nr:GNAT family N-acetyltransferase [Lachnospiraceae bacterium]